MRRILTGLGLAWPLTIGVARADSVGEVRTGNAAFGDGRYEAAVEAFTRAILAGDLDPEALAITFNNRGVAYSELGDYDRAIADYGQALTLVPGDRTAIKNLRIAHIRRAAAAARLGEQAAGAADYDRAIELEPTHPLAYMRRGQLRARSRRPRRRHRRPRPRARELDPENARHRHAAGGRRAACRCGSQLPTAAPPPAGRATADHGGSKPPAAGRCRSRARLPIVARTAQSAQSLPSPRRNRRRPPARPGRPFASSRTSMYAPGPGNDFARIGGSLARRCGDRSSARPGLAAAAA